MKTLQEAINRSFHKDIYKCILSNPAHKESTYKKVELNLLEGFYQAAKYTETQVFHEKLSYDEAKKYIEGELKSTFRNLNAWDAAQEFSIRVSKKGKVLFTKNAAKPQQAPKKALSHNREKNYIFAPGTRIEPLVDMGVLTKEGRVVQSMYDKYRQINRFIEIVDDEVRKIDKKELTILDFGCGKSYLTFVLYYYFTEIRKLKINMIGLDLKADVIEKCSAAAEKYGYKGLCFEVGDIGSFQYENHVDMVITLHACDTATDYALFNAVRWNTDRIFSVPCCQHELNGQIQSDSLSLLTRYGIVKERFSSLLTDAIRCNLLECCGYKTQMIEFVAFDHTPKNVMIRAVKRPKTDQKARLAEVEAAIAEFHVEPTLYRLMKKERMLLDGIADVAGSPQ